jgi:hypothetical protein
LPNAAEKPPKKVAGTFAADAGGMHVNLKLASFAVLGALLFACSSSTTDNGSDSGTPITTDGSTSDATSPDGSSGDSSTVIPGDAATGDSATSDAATTDAESADAAGDSATETDASDAAAAHD